MSVTLLAIVMLLVVYNSLENQLLRLVDFITYAQMGNASFLKEPRTVVVCNTL